MKTEWWCHLRLFVHSISSTFSRQSSEADSYTNIACRETAEDT